MKMMKSYLMKEKVLNQDLISIADAIASTGALGTSNTTTYVESLLV